MNDRHLKKRAQKSIEASLKAFRGESYVDQPRQVVKHGRYRQLSRHQIDQGVVALVLHCNLSGGSVLDVDLYRLMRTYMWDEEARAAINRIVADKNQIGINNGNNGRAQNALRSRKPDPGKTGP